MKLLHTITFLPMGSSYNFYLRFYTYPSHLKINSNLLVQQTTPVSQVLCSHSFLYQELHWWIKAKPPLISLIKRSLSTFINKCLIVIQRDSTLTLWGLSWPWRKRFVPGIISFVSLWTSQIILKRVALFLFLLHSLHENPRFSKIPLLIILQAGYLLDGYKWSCGQKLATWIINWKQPFKRG